MKPQLQRLNQARMQLNQLSQVLSQARMKPQLQRLNQARMQLNQVLSQTRM